MGSAMNETQQLREPSAYALYRELKAAGYVPSANLDGKIMVSVSEEVPDAPASNSSDRSQDFLNDVILEGNRIDLTSQD